jgi:type IX secretion system PorP/SprF family membrane protein
VKRLLLITTLLAMCGIALGQDHNFSQFYELPLMRNPALAGIFDCNFRVKSVYRSQWQSVTVPYQTAGLSAEMKLPAGSDDWHTLGLQVIYDVAGDSRFKRIEVLPVYTLHIKVAEENYVSAGIMAGPVNSQFDASKLYWDDQFVNGAFSPANPTQQLLKSTAKNYFELALGAAFTRPLGELGSLYVGVSGYHLNKPQVSFDVANNNKLQPRYGFNAGLTVPSGARNAFTFYTDAFLQGGHQQGMFGGLYTLSLADEYYDDINKSSLHLGGVYRWNDAFIPVVKLDYGQLSFGLSYDVNVSKLKTASQSRGGFEFTLSYRNCSIGGNNNDLPCPKFGKVF